MRNNGLASNISGTRRQVRQSAAPEWALVRSTHQATSGQAGPKAATVPMSGHDEAPPRTDGDMMVPTTRKRRCTEAVSGFGESLEKFDGNSMRNGARVSTTSFRNGNGGVIPNGTISNQQRGMADINAAGDE